MNPSLSVQSRILSIPLVWVLSACASYEPYPLPDWSASIGAAPDQPADSLTLSSAVAWMLSNNEPLSAARGEWRAARALADHPTPLQNPTFSIGPVFLSGAGSVPGAEQALEAALGWVLPLSGVRSATDDLNGARARAARNGAVVVARTEYLALRGELLALAVQIERAAQARRAHAVLRDLADQERAMGAAGSRVDLHVAQLEALAAASTASQQEAAVLLGRGAVARRCGAAVQRVTDLPLRVLPKLPASAPSVAALHAALEQHPDLVALRGQYEVAESGLRREVRRQYPDLGIGGEQEREQGGQRLALPLGITLPVFDTNQRGIAEARARRESIRERYQVRARALARGVEVARGVLGQEQARYAALNGEVKRVVETLRASVNALLSANRMGARQRVRIYQSVFAAQSAELDARDAVLQSWSMLERACGAPLLPLPGQPDAPGKSEVK